MSLHRFNPDIAKVVGTNAATIFENLCHWTRKNQANGKHFYDEKTWTYNSINAFVELFPYLSKDQIRGAIKKLIKANLIETGNYNKKGYDRTIWYAVKIPHDLVKIPNGVGENPKPIPDNKPDNKLTTTSARPDKLISEALGNAVNPQAQRMYVMMEPLSWTQGKNACDFELDLLPVIKRIAERAEPRSISSWNYFKRAVFEPVSYTHLTLPTTPYV